VLGEITRGLLRLPFEEWIKGNAGAYTLGLTPERARDHKVVLSTWSQGRGLWRYRRAG
jgi:hypothetical protein